MSGVRVYEDRFEWLLNLSPDAGGGLDDAGSPVYCLYSGVKTLAFRRNL